MNQSEWRKRITYAVRLAADGMPSRLDEMAQTLADADTAKEVLISANFGKDDDPLLELVAAVVERNDDGRSTI